MPGGSAKIFGSVVLWVVILYFITAATQELRLHTFAGWLSRVVDYLRTVFVGAMIIAASRLTRQMVEAAVAKEGERSRALIGRVVQAAILTT